MADDQGSEGRALTAHRSVAAVALCAALLVSACATDPGSVLVSEPNIFPANYRADILAYLKTYLNDPVGIREAFIAEPVLRTVDGTTALVTTQRYLVCLRFNAKNSVGRYEGSRDRVVAFLSGRLDTMAFARGEQCKDAVWIPFPELEQLKR
jgi:hypothetical protein